MKDKIIQIATGDYDNHRKYGLGESGTLYRISNDCKKWEKYLESPEIIKRESTQVVTPESD